MQKINRMGEQRINKWGSLMTIVEYRNARDITVEFENGYKTHTSYNYFQKGSIKSPYDKTVYGFGYLGEGEYNSRKNGEKTIQYQYWIEMIKRCYELKSIIKRPTYGNKYVCEEWLNFQSFAKWFDENWYVCNNQKMQLDKDILQKGNRVYSPENCVFVPDRINTLFVKCDTVRGQYPIGVMKTKYNKFVARCSTLEKRIHLGHYKTPEEAFHKYKEFKERYIKQVAEEYRDKIPQKLYDAMYRYEVEITD